MPSSRWSSGHLSWAGLSLVLWLPVTTAAQAQDLECSNPLAHINRAEEQINSYFFADADKTLGDLRTALVCGPPPEARVVAKAWLIHATRFHLDGDNAKTTAFLAAAKAYDLTVTPEDTELLALWNDAQPEGTVISIKGLPKAWTFIVDNEALGIGRAIDTGPHLLRAGPSESDLRWATYQFAAPGEPMLVELPPFEGVAETIDIGIEKKADIKALRAFVSRDLWDRAERLYASQLELATDKALAEWHELGAQVSSGVGNAAQRLERLQACAAVYEAMERPIPKRIQGDIDFLTEEYRAVRIYGYGKPTLTPLIPPNELSNKRAVALAVEKLESTGVFEGRLPTGPYTVDDVEIDVAKGVDVLEFGPKFWRQLKKNRDLIRVSASSVTELGLRRFASGSFEDGVANSSFISQNLSIRARIRLSPSVFARVNISPGRVLTYGETAMNPVIRPTPDARGAGRYGGALLFGNAWIHGGPWGGVVYNGILDKTADRFAAHVGATVQYERKGYDFTAVAAANPMGTFSEVSMGWFPGGGPLRIGGITSLTTSTFDVEGWSERDRVRLMRFGLEVGAALRKREADQ